MAKTKKTVLKITLAVCALGVGSANASDLWLTSNPLFDALNASSSASSAYGVSSLSSQWTGASTQATSQWSVASANNSSWFSSNWSTGASTAQQPVLADDLYRNLLYTGGSSSSSTVASSSTGGAWFSSYFGNEAASTSTSQSGSSSWGSSWASNWGSSSSSSSNSITSGWWNSGTWGVSSGAAANTGAWWSSYGGWGGTAAVSSDNTACNMVSSWAGAPSWRDYWGDTGASSAASSSSVMSISCNQAQSSTIGNLATNNNLVATNAPIGGPVVVEDFGPAVPEPSTWMLMIGGLAMIGYNRRKRNVA